MSIAALQLQPIDSKSCLHCLRSIASLAVARTMVAASLRLLERRFGHLWERASYCLTSLTWTKHHLGGQLHVLQVVLQHRQALSVQTLCFGFDSSWCDCIGVWCLNLIDAHPLTSWWQQ